MVHMMELLKQCLDREEGSKEIQDRLVEIEEEQKRLLHAYRKSYITEAEFVAAREECRQEEERYKSMSRRGRKDNALISEIEITLDMANADNNNLNDKVMEERVESIKGILQDIIYGVGFNDTVCQEIVEKIVRIALDTYDVYYKGLPGGWRVYWVEEGRKTGY